MTRRFSRGNGSSPAKSACVGEGKAAAPLSGRLAIRARAESFPVSMTYLGPRGHPDRRTESERALNGVERVLRGGSTETVACRGPSAGRTAGFTWNGPIERHVLSTQSELDPASTGRMVLGDACMSPVPVSAWSGSRREPSSVRARAGWLELKAVLRSGASNLPVLDAMVAKGGWSSRWQG